MREFKSFGAFARHLEVLAAEGEAVTHHVVKKAAELIQENAQERIGQYQAAAGPFEAWAPLAEATKADRVSQGFPADEPLLRTGDLRDSIEMKAHRNEAVVGSASMIALYQEVGTEKIPPRPFLGPAAFTRKRRITAMAVNTMIAWIAGHGWRRPRALIVNAETIE